MEKLIFIGPASKLALIRTRFRSLQGVTISDGVVATAPTSVDTSELEGKIIDQTSLKEAAHDEILRLKGVIDEQTSSVTEQAATIQVLNAEIERLNTPAKLIPAPEETVTKASNKSTKAKTK